MAKKDEAKAEEKKVAKTEKVEVQYPFQVAPGQSVTFKGKMLREGAEVKSEMFGEGDAGKTRLDALVSKKIVLKVLEINIEI